MSGYPPHLQDRLDTLIRHSQQIVKRSGMTNRTPIPGATMWAPWKWQYTKSGPLLIKLIAVLDACGFEIIIRRKDATDETSD